MAKWDAERRILNHPHTGFWRDITPQGEADPDFQPDILPCEKICPIDFGRKIFTIFPAQNCFLTDAPFRDAPSGRPLFSANRIADIAKKFRQAGPAYSGDPHLMPAATQAVDPCHCDGVKIYRWDKSQSFV